MKKKFFKPVDINKKTMVVLCPKGLVEI